MRYHLKNIDTGYSYSHITQGIDCPIPFIWGGYQKYKISFNKLSFIRSVFILSKYRAESELKKYEFKVLNIYE